MSIKKKKLNFLNLISVMLLIVAFFLLTIPVFARSTYSVYISDGQEIVYTELPDIYINSGNPGQEMPEATAISNGTALYTLVADDVSSSGLTQISNQIMYLTNAGYDTIYCKLTKSAKQIKSMLSDYNFIILHGHGLAGQLLVKSSSTGNSPYSNSTLYSVKTSSMGTNDEKLSNLSMNELSSVKIIIFTSCRSGLTDSTYITSLANMAYQRGAEASLGYKIDVSGGEWYSALVVGALKWGYTLEDALQYADTQYNNYYSVVTENSPAIAANRVVYGDKKVTL